MCGQVQHKNKPKCKNVRWLSGCISHNWYPESIFKTRPDAIRFFKDHKHDAVWTYSEAMQTALANLEAEAIAYTIE